MKRLGGGEEIGLAVSPPQKVTFIKPVVHQVILENSSRNAWGVILWNGPKK